MPTDLAHHIQETPLVDTHEHLDREPSWVDDGPDILGDLFGNYVVADLITAGASPQAMTRLKDGNDPDIAGRFEGIRTAWEATQFTGYGEAVRLIANHAYDIDELSGRSIEMAQHKNRVLREPGERYRLLHDVANLDHTQTDDGQWECAPDESGLDFFLYDLSWRAFCNGEIDPEKIEAETGVVVTDLGSLKRGMEAIFAKARSDRYCRKSSTRLQPNPRLDRAHRLGSGYRARNRIARRGDGPPNPTLPRRLVLGAGRRTDDRAQPPVQNPHRLLRRKRPYALEQNSRREHVRTLRPLSGAKFVLMHIAYPYNDELVALAKHYRNIWVDMCWAWSIDPYSSRDFLRRFIHAVPINKIFAFGGDTHFPTGAMAYAIQARTEITRALESEIADGYMTEKGAMAIAERIMRDNQFDCFDIAGTRSNIRAAA